MIEIKVFDYYYNGNESYNVIDHNHFKFSSTQNTIKFIYFSC